MAEGKNTKGNVETIGTINAYVNLDTSQLKQATADVDKYLNYILYHSFQKSHKDTRKFSEGIAQSVAQSLSEVAKTANTASKTVINASKYVEKQTKDSVNKAVTDLSKLAKASATASTANAKALTNSTIQVREAVTQSTYKVVKFHAQLQNILKDESKILNKHLKTLEKFSTLDLSKSLNALAIASERNSATVVKNLEKIQRQAERTTQALKDMSSTKTSFKEVAEASSPKVTFAQDFGRRRSVKDRVSGTGFGVPFEPHGATVKAVNQDVFKIDEMAVKAGGLRGAIESALPALNKGFKALKSWSFQMFLIEQAFYQIQGLADALVKPALDFNAQMETLRLGYAGILSSTALENGQEIPYERALKLSDQLLVKLQDEAIKTSLTINELGTALQATMGMGFNAGMKMTEILDLTVVAAQAVKTFGLGNQQVIQEIRGLISGEAIRPGVDQLATVLGYTTATVNKLREEGKLYEDIMKRMSGFRSSSEAFQDSWAGLISNTQDGMQRVAGEAGKAMFESLKGALVDFQGLFYTLSEKKVKDSEGNEKAVYKVNVNQQTVELLRSFYNIIGDLTVVLMDMLNPAIQLLTPIVIVLLDAVEGCTRALKMLSVAISPIYDLLGDIGDALHYVFNYLSEVTLGMTSTQDATVVLTAILGVALLAITAFTKKWFALIYVLSLVVKAFKLFTNPVSHFDKWIVSKVDSWIYKWKAFLAAIQGDDSLAKSLNATAEKLDFGAEHHYQEMAKEFTKGIHNFVTEVDKVTDGGLSNLSGKHKAGDVAGKDNKPSNTKLAKAEYRALEASLRQKVETLTEHQRQLKALYNNDLVSTEDYVNAVTKIQTDAFDEEIKSLKQRQAVAEKYNLEADTSRFKSEAETVEVKKLNLQKEATRLLTEEYKKLDERLMDISHTYEDLVGVSEEAFNYNLAKEWGAVYVRVLAEINTANDKLQKAVENGSEKEINLLQEKLDLYKKSKEQIEKIIEVTALQRRAEIAGARVEGLDLKVSEDYLLVQNALNNSAITSLDAEQKLYNLRMENAEEYKALLQEQIGIYTHLAETSEDIFTQNKFKAAVLEAKQALIEFENSLSPIEKQIKETFQDGLSDMFQAITWQEKSAKEALEDFATSMTQMWTKMMFDRLATDMTNAIFGFNPEQEQQLNYQVNIDTSAFKNSLLGSATTIQEHITSGLLPAFESLRQASINLANTLNGADGGGGGNPTPVGNSFNLGNALPIDVSGKGNESSGTIEFGTGASTSKDLTVMGESIDTSVGSLKDFSAELKQGAISTDDIKNANKEVSDMAIPMLITSLLSASGQLGDFGIILQHVMMAMQIAQATGILGFGKAEGGYIQGAGTGTSDSIPARLSNGEYVLRAAAVKKLGVNFLDQLNNIDRGSFRHSTKLPKFAYATGGYVSGGGGGEGNNSSSSNSFNNTPTVVMNMNFQSLDPEANMKLMNAQYPSIRRQLIKDLQGNTSVRTAVKGASK